MSRSVAVGVMVLAVAVLVTAVVIGLASPAASPRPAPASTPGAARVTASPVASPTNSPADSVDPTPTPEAAVLVGAGDIADCDESGDESTAALLDAIEGTVFTSGDNAYDSGTPEEFAECYEPTWGRHRARTRPAPGNHDYETPGAAGYFEYFGAAAGEPGVGYYSYDLGAWHIIALNSICDAVGGCGPGSAQEQWLRADLAEHAAMCTLAYWHHPRFSSGQHGNDDDYDAFWRALYEAGADVVLGGHDHTYERFAPQTPDAELDVARGIREFVVGSGGKSHYRFEDDVANSEARNNDTFGVLKLTLRASDYDWEFIPVQGSAFTDSGTDACH